MTKHRTGPRPTFLAECYAPALGLDEPMAATHRVANACDEMRSAGADIEYLGALLVPGDELAYHVFSSANRGDVRDACARAGFDVDRVVASVAIGLLAARGAVRQALSVAVEVDRTVTHPTGEIGP